MGLPFPSYWSLSPARLPVLDPEQGDSRGNDEGGGGDGGEERRGEEERGGN